MNLRARRHTRNDTLKDICFLVAPPIYSFIRQGCKDEDVVYALLFLFLEVISFTLDVLGGSHLGWLLASFLFTAIIIVPVTIYVYFIKRSKIAAVNKPEAEQLFMMEIISTLIQLILSGVSFFKTLSGVNTNYSPSLFPLAFAISAVVYAFKNSKAVPHSSSHTSSNTPPDQLGDAEHTDLLQLTNVKVDPSNTSSQVSEIEVIPTTDIPNKDFVPISSNAIEVQQARSTNTLRKRRNASSQSDQGQKNEVIRTTDSVPFSHANEIQPEPSASAEQSDDNQLDNDQGYRYKKPVLVLLFLLLETTSIALDHFGGSNRNVLLASFGLSAFAYVISLYNWMTIPAVTILDVLKQSFMTTNFEVGKRSTVATTIDFTVIVFSSFWLISKYMVLIESYNESFLLVSSFAIITLVFVEIALLVPRIAGRPRFHQILQVLLILWLALLFMVAAFRVNKEGWHRGELFRRPEQFPEDLIKTNFKNTVGRQYSVVVMGNTTTNPPFRNGHGHQFSTK